LILLLLLLVGPAGTPPIALQPSRPFVLLTPFLVSPFISRGAPRQRGKKPLLAKGEVWARNNQPVKFSQTIRLPRNCRVLLHAAKLRHGTDGCSSPQKEGMLRIFFALKIRRLRPGLKPRTWVPEASMLTARPPKPLQVDSYRGLEIRDRRNQTQRKRLTRSYYSFPFPSHLHLIDSINVR
jgi:hypothetical protein